MDLRFNPAFANSIHVVPAKDLADAKASAEKARPGQIGLAPSEGGPKVTWPILVPSDDLKAKLTEDPKLFGEYLSEAVTANGGYFFPKEKDKDPVYGQRARELFDEAIGLVRELYPPSISFGNRDVAYRQIDRQVDRVFQRVYGGGRPTRPGDIWNDDSHWPVSPVWGARMEDHGLPADTPEFRSFVTPLNLLDRHQYTPVYKMHSLLSEDVDWTKFKPVFESGVPVPGTEELAKLRTMDHSKILILDMCHGLDADQAWRDGVVPPQTSEYFAKKPEEDS